MERERRLGGGFVLTMWLLGLVQGYLLTHVAYNLGWLGWW